MEPYNTTLREAYKSLTGRNKGQLSYLWGLERFENATCGYQFNASCECGAVEIFSHCEEACYFILDHAGHKIWISTDKRDW